MKRLIDLAKQIDDVKLRKLTIEFLEKPKISNKSMDFPCADLEKAPCWAIGAHHSYEGGLVDHTYSVTKNAISLAENFKKIYKTEIKMDMLIAGALLHDIMKLFIIKKTDEAWDFTGCILDHADFTACELYARGFPEEVVHIVASHGGEMGAASANPRTVEAMIVYYCDTLDSSIETATNEKTDLEKLKQLIMMQGGAVE